MIRTDYKSVSTINQYNQYQMENFWAQKGCSQPEFLPHEGIKGRWVQRSQFQSTSQTFGYFQCNYCSKNWMSAYSQKKFKQACKQCERYFLALFLWKNDYVKYDKKDKSLEDNGKPHMTEYCQACQKGMCKMGKNNKGYDDIEYLMKKMKL